MSLIDTVRQLWLVIRNEKDKNANTAERVGDAGAAILDVLEDFSNTIETTYAKQSTETVFDWSTQAPGIADVHLAAISYYAKGSNVASVADKDTLGQVIHETYATKGELNDIELTPGPKGNDAPLVIILYGELPVAIGPMWHSDVRELDVYMRISTDNGSTYSNPLKFKGNDGIPGDDAPQVIIKYAVTGDTMLDIWHSTVEPDDMYMKVSTDGGATYSYAMKFKGVDGGTGIEALGYAMSDPASDITAGIKIPCAAVPYAFTITGIRAQLGRAAIGALKLTIDIKKNGTSILSTLLTFDSTETISEGAATPYVLTSPSISITTSDVIELSVPMAGGITQAAQNLTLFLIGHKTI